jgi:hypothetical protein
MNALRLSLTEQLRRLQWAAELRARAAERPRPPGSGYERSKADVDQLAKQGAVDLVPVRASRSK